MPNLPRRPGWKRWLPRSLGDINKREQMLMMLGLIWFMIGVSTFGSLESSRQTLLHEYLSPEVRGILWMTSGVAAILAAFRPRGYRDRFGWAFLYIMPTLRVLSYLLSWLASVNWLPLDDWAFTEAYEDGWRFGIVYLAQTLTVVICSGWPNPVRPEDLKLNEKRGVTHGVG